ncbi:MAG TPA: hypothetical protein VIG88_03470 [Lysobacter sp.]
MRVGDEATARDVEHCAPIRVTASAGIGGAMRRVGGGRHTIGAMQETVGRPSLVRAG